MYPVVPPGLPVAPPTELLESMSTDELPSTSSSSTNIKDFHDGVPIEYNSEMSDRGPNIETSDEFDNQAVGTARSHRIAVPAEDVFSPKPVNEGNVRVSGQSKDDRQAKLVSKIQELVNLDDVQLEPGTPFRSLFLTEHCRTVPCKKTRNPILTQVFEADLSHSS